MLNARSLPLLKEVASKCRALGAEEVRGTLFLFSLTLITYGWITAQRCSTTTHRGALPTCSNSGSGGNEHDFLPSCNAGQVVVHAGDLSTAEGSKALVDATAAAFGGIDLLVRFRGGSGLCTKKCDERS